MVEKHMYSAKYSLQHWHSQAEYFISDWIPTAYHRRRFYWFIDALQMQCVYCMWTAFFLVIFETFDEIVGVQLNPLKLSGNITYHMP